MLKKLVVFILSLFLVAVAFISCTHKSFRNQPKHFYFEDAYSLKDTLYVKDYVMNSYFYYTNRDYRNWASADSIQQNLNTDSVFTIFKNTLLSMNLPIKFEGENTNRNDSTFIKNPFLDIKKIDKEIVKKVRSKNKINLVPIFSFSNLDAGDNGFSSTRIVNKTLIISIFVFKRENIIYYKSNRITSGTPCPANECSLDDVVISQDLWGDLVYQVMKQYLKRLK